MAVVRVPKTPKKAFDRSRRPSTLLLSQIEHLEWAVLPASQRKPGQLSTKKVKTEAQAAERVAQLMKMLHESKAAAESASPTAAVILPPLPKVPTQSLAEKSRRRKKSTQKKSRGRRRPR